MSVPTVDVLAGDLEPGMVVGYTPIAAAGRVTAVVQRSDVMTGGMVYVTLLLALTDEIRHVWCTPAATLPVEQPARYSDVVVPRPVFACPHANEDDGCCNHPGTMDAECWTIGPRLGNVPGWPDEEIAGTHWAPCPLVPYPDGSRP